MFCTDFVAIVYFVVVVVDFKFCSHQAKERKFQETIFYLEPNIFRLL